ncbi:MAG: DUF5696 domain-containing protein [Clostridia bacterium]|nr:DUF5696 domain-containing protein [Clostridia bacterium]
MTALNNFKARSNSGEEIECTYDCGRVTVSAAAVPPGTEYIDLYSDSLCADAGEDGYYVIADADAKGSRLCLFNHKPDGERCFRQALMPIFGIKTQTRCTLIIADGMSAVFHLVFGVKDGRYYAWLRFVLDGCAPYEDISVLQISLDPDGGYSEIAAAYREYRLSRGECRPIIEKQTEREALRYAVQSPEIRIRMGWKPAPPTVLEQTAENEPDMYVACTFDRVREFIAELKRQGVERAEICLVGWNVSGHDGRYPQLFPVEPRLGGEEKLKSLIAYAKECGYKIVCHTNSTDCYSIADRFSEDIVAKESDGSLSINSAAWSGGRMYNLCPTSAERFAAEDLPKVAELGFEGLHYIDVMSVIPLRWCHDTEHPSNPRQTLEHYRHIMNECHELFGGFASEGVFDFASEYLDFGLYISWPAIPDEMLDREIPLWSLVYHGIILANPTTDTVNYPIKDAKNRLTVMEYGARPAFYIYSKFMKGGNQDDWLGKEDLILDTDEDLCHAAKVIKDACDEYAAVSDLQTEYILKHEEISENIFEVTYSNGRKITVDYNGQTYSID